MNNRAIIGEAFEQLNRMPRMKDSRTSLNESSHNYKMFTVDDEDSHVVVKDINGVVQSRADSVEEAHEQIENELCTCRASIDLQNISEEDLHLLCNNSNISIIQEEPINLLNCIFQGDKGNIRSLLDDLKNMRSVDNFKMLGESMNESEDGDDLQVFYRRDGKWVPKEELEEAQMSPEDKADSEILRNILINKYRPSDKLNRKELSVLDKYGLTRDTIHGQTYVRDADGNVLATNNRNYKNPKVKDDRVNLADRARKMSDRNDHSDDDYNYIDWGGHSGQNRVRYKNLETDRDIQNYKLQKNYNRMKNSLNHRNDEQSKINKLLRKD